MGGAPIVIPLVGLVVPILLLLLALLFDLGVLGWAVYRLWKQRARPQLLILGARLTEHFESGSRYRPRWLHR
jgi:hypothetical protein